MAQDKAMDQIDAWMDRKTETREMDGWRDIQRGGAQHRAVAIQLLSPPRCPREI